MLQEQDALCCIISRGCGHSGQPDVQYDRAQAVTSDRDLAVRLAFSGACTGNRRIKRTIIRFQSFNNVIFAC